MIVRKPFTPAAALCLSGAGALLISSGGLAQTPLDAHRTLGTAKSYRNLTLVPVYDSQAKPADTYTTLDEGLKAGTVKVKEAQGGGDVNTLYVTNSGRKPLYVMAGEVVLGGQQDRTLGQDAIIPPGKKQVPVTVFCVEHGRWTGRSEFGASAPSLAGKDIRMNAMAGQFRAARSVAASPALQAGGADAQSPDANVILGRRRVQRGQADGAGISNTEDVGSAQQQVWDSVAKKNAYLKIKNDTGAYRDALAMKGGDAHNNVPAYIHALSSSLGDDPRLVGVAEVVNGKIIAADIFGDPHLFRKLWPKLLRSYAADAVEGMQDKARQAQGRPAGTSAVQMKAFLSNARNEKSKEVNRGAAASLLHYENAETATYSLVPDKQPAASPLHESVLRK